jgi:asparagine synthase (glutamine-hydrolysing)
LHTLSVVCGIGGCVLALGEAPSHTKLARMRDAMAHRGPDGSGVLITENVGLVSTRLAIVEQGERGAQPMTHPAGRWAIAYNGELYNHLELRRELDGPFRGAGDTETALHALARWGPAAIDRFRGQFALAALDLETGRLVLARDGFGIKPLYLANFGGGIWFASELDALLAAGAPRRAALPQLARSIDFPYSPGRATALEGIEALSPGTWRSLDLTSMQATERRYFSPARAVDPELQDELARRPRRRLLAELDAALRASVESTLMADVPVAAMLSGGLDSSLIAAHLAELRPGSIAFSATLAGRRLDADGRAATVAARALELELETVSVDASSWCEGLVAATRHFGGPLVTPSSVVIAQIAARARKRGRKVLLTGEGADELFDGYDIHSITLQAFLGRRRYLRQRLGPGRLPGQSRSLLRALAARRGDSEALGPRLPVKHEWASEVSRQHAASTAYEHHDSPRRDLEVMLLSDLESILPPLLQRMDAGNMQNSVEARVPMLEAPLVNLAVNLPLEARVAPFSKGLLRESARRRLPRAIVARPKVRGMMFDVRGWLTERARPRFLLDGALRELFGVEAGDWLRLVERSEAERVVRLWSAEIWCRSAVEGTSDDAIGRELWRAHA